VSVLYFRVQDSTQATQDPGALDPCAQKIVQKRALLLRKNLPRGLRVYGS
jgi:hypothetical protein